MKLYSTNKKVQSVSIQDAVLQGLATDGGLFMPQEIPNLQKSQIPRWACAVFELLTSDIPNPTLGL